MPSATDLDVNGELVLLSIDYSTSMLDWRNSLQEPVHLIHHLLIGVMQCVIHHPLIGVMQCRIQYRNVINAVHNAITFSGGAYSHYFFPNV